MARKKSIPTKRRTHLSFMVIFKSENSEKEFGITVFANTKEEALEQAYQSYETLSGKNRQDLSVTVDVTACH